MTRPVRKFEDKRAVRERVPLLIGLMGPSGGGKTFSGLRLASGIQSIVGGDIGMVDTEGRRGLNYADDFKFHHLDFQPPFGSLDYLEAIRHFVTKGVKTVLVDSMTHEHIGQGGYLETAEAEIDRLAGDDYAKRDRVKMLGWAKVGPLRQKMIEGIKQLNVNMIFCYRAKEKTKPVRRDNKMEAVSMGFMPIAGEELLFEMTLNCLLMPKADGVPTWRSDNIGERMMMKLPKQFIPLFEKPRALDEAHGAALAEWAAGKKIKSSGVRLIPSAGKEEGAPRAYMGKPGAPDPHFILNKASQIGWEALKKAWTAIPESEKTDELRNAMEEIFKPAARAVGGKK